VAEEHCMSQEEFVALDGQPAEFLGGRHFRVGRAIVEVQDGYHAPYGVPITWSDLPAEATVRCESCGSAL